MLLQKPKQIDPLAGLYNLLHCAHLQIKKRKLKEQEKKKVHELQKAKEEQVSKKRKREERRVRYRKQEKLNKKMRRG